MQSSAPEPQSTSLAFSGTSGILRKLWGLSLERIKGRIPLLFPQEGGWGGGQADVTPSSQTS